MNKPLKLVTISKDMEHNLPKIAEKVRLFNFSEGKIDLDLSDRSSKLITGSMHDCWIRVWDKEKKYYDFITDSVFFSANAEGIILMCSEDTEFIDADYISKLIASSYQKLEAHKYTAAQYVDKYTTYVEKEVKEASKDLAGLYSLSAQAASSRADIEDSYEYGRSVLLKKFLLNLVAVKIIKENKAQIQELVGSAK